MKNSFTENGVVVNTALKKGMCKVELLRNENCDSCRLCEVSADGKRAYIKARGNRKLENGDRVEVYICGFREKLFTVLIYLLPLLLTVAAFLAGSFYSDKLRAIFTAASAAVGLAAMVLFHFLVVKKKLVPYVSKVLSADYKNND